jgi:hypothetical protein
MTSTVPAPQVDPRSFAEALTTTILPAILNGEHSETISAVWGQRLGHLADAAETYRRSHPEEHQAALLAAAEPFAPPRTLIGASATYNVLIGVIALRAATSELLSVPDVHERYKHAASWVCVNFGSLIWWNCD